MIYFEVLGAFCLFVGLIVLLLFALKFIRQTYEMRLVLMKLTAATPDNIQSVKDLARKQLGKKYGMLSGLCSFVICKKQVEDLSNQC